jgi:hypothetical protein
MATGTAVGKLADGGADNARSSSVQRTYSAEFLAEHEAIMARVREEGASRIRRSCERAVAMGIIDKDGNLLKKELPADMLSGSDRDFGG